MCPDNGTGSPESHATTAGAPPPLVDETVALKARIAELEAMLDSAAKVLAICRKGGLAVAAAADRVLG